MSDILKRFFRLFLNPKFIGFCIIGVINTLVTAFFSWLTHSFIQDNAAAVIGYAISLTGAFFLNCKFLFKGRATPERYVRFLLSYVPNFIIYFLTSFITINVLHIGQFWATILAAMVGGPVTFVIIKLYVFGGKAGEKDVSRQAHK